MLKVGKNSVYEYDETKHSIDGKWIPWRHPSFTGKGGVGKRRIFYCAPHNIPDTSSVCQGVICGSCVFMLPKSEQLAKLLAAEYLERIDSGDKEV